MGTDRSADDTDTGGQDPAGPVLTRRWSRDDPGAIPSEVVRAVASAADVDPMSMSRPLHDVLDPDALATLLTSGTGQGDVTVTFEMEGVTVTASNDGRIVVEDGEPAE